jgi:hypothetical protein
MKLNVNMSEIYAIVGDTWVGGPTSLDNPENQDPITLSKKEIIEFGGVEKEKLNFTIQYDVTDMKYAANLSITLVFDKSIIVGQTDLKSVQGSANMAFRMPFLPKYDNQKKIGKHNLEIILKIRPRYTIWHLINNLKDYLELRKVADSVATRTVILKE